MTLTPHETIGARRATTPARAALLAIGLLLPLGTLAGQGPTAPVRIMPLGDSITEAEGGWSSYRHWLWHELVSAGYSIDFVGTQNGVCGGTLLHPAFDRDHEGHCGWRADNIAAWLPGWALTHQPDLVLMHLGTNDINQGQSHASTLADLTLIVQQLRAVNPGVVVLAAQLIPASPPVLAAGIPAFNALLPAWASGLTTPASPLILVDHFSGFDVMLDTYDGVHPDESGEKKLAERWLEALAPRLGPLRLTMSLEVISGDALIRNLAGPPGGAYFTALTFDPANAGAGLGTGWFAGLHVTLGELLAQSLSGAPPFVGTLGATGASVTRFPAAALAPFVGATLYGVTHTLDSGGSITAVSPPTAFSIQ